MIFLNQLSVLVSIWYGAKKIYRFDINPNRYIGIGMIVSVEPYVLDSVLILRPITTLLFIILLQSVQGVKTNNL